MTTAAAPIVSGITFDIELIATAIQKLDEFFKDPQNRQKYLDRNGWLGPDGMKRMLQRWTPYALCLLVLKVTSSSIDKNTSNIVSMNLSLHGVGAHASLCNHHRLSNCFTINAKNFYWIGGNHAH